jgi:hypothetical protein
MRLTARRIYQHVMFLLSCYGLGWHFTYSSAAREILLGEAMAANAVLFMVSGLCSFRRGRWMQLLTAAFLAVYLALTISDQMGIWDYLTPALDVAAISSFLWATRRSSH